MEKKARAIIMGDKIYAGITMDDISEVKNAIVIEFKDNKSQVEALRTGKVEFSMFEWD